MTIVIIITTKEGLVLAPGQISTGSDTSTNDFYISEYG